MRHEHAIALANATTFTGKSVDFTGEWKNDLEQSHMTLTQMGQALTGKYTSSDGSGGTITGQLVGSSADNIISFVVNWPNPSVTAWTGHLVTENNTESIETLWHLALPMKSPADPAKLWMTMLTGSDRFTRVVVPPQPANEAATK